MTTINTAEIEARLACKTSEHDVIWLSPACDDERLWCQDNAFEPCDTCGAGAVKFVRADIAEAALKAETARADKEGEHSSLLMRDNADIQQQLTAANEKLAAARNWPEDASHENGNYECKCMSCGSSFTGHKRRVVCKLCATIGDGNGR